ncbi:hypothetical protein [Streptomyces spororaveus]|uniref:hypothetical protein n=1 Tax=Streptomyces spororaveus TaxID=284039 RepID=UPI0019229B45|nr:hypothetical protein [Streptomyces spororaveus]
MSGRELQQPVARLAAPLGRVHRQLPERSAPAGAGQPSGVVCGADTVTVPTSAPPRVATRHAPLLSRWRVSRGDW